ncbi:MAG: hypothetical protein QW506_02995 [Thermoproteota archaeon]
MEDGVRRIFIERADLFLKIMDERWPRTEVLVDGIVIHDSQGYCSG